MPVSDTYLVQYLLQETTRAQHAIAWRERVAEAGFVADVGSLEVALESVASRGGSRLSLIFRGAADHFQISEPVSDGWFCRRYATPEEHALADLLQDLMRTVEMQCRERRLNTLLNPEPVRERVFRQLVFGAPERAVEDATLSPR